MVRVIEYKGKQLPIRVSYYAMKMTRREMKKKESGSTQTELEFQDKLKEIETNPEAFDIETYETMLWYALKAGAEHEDTEVTIPREKMEFVLDMCFKEFMEMVSEFTPQMTGDATEDGETTEIKKVVPVENRRQRRAKAKGK